MAVSAELRCLVCQNQTIADSHAELAVDLKNQVREKLRQGMSEQEIKDYMVARYGDFVLYRPLVKRSTWLLWFGPLLLLILAFGVLVVKLRQRRKAMQQTPALSAAEHARADLLLSGADKGKQP
jgi:cytochrome c-type biogenesis protein CcmH